MTQLTSGCHIKVSRVFYSHHGVYLGDGRVAHFTGLSDGFDFSKEAIIEETSLHDFCAGGDAKVVSRPGLVFSADEVVKRARSRVGKTGYSIFSNNCEHFANWCLKGEKSSSQVWTGVASAVALLPVVAGVLIFVGSGGRKGLV